jgi:hypothetical protein
VLECIVLNAVTVLLPCNPLTLPSVLSLPHAASLASPCDAQLCRICCAEVAHTMSTRRSSWAWLSCLLATLLAAVLSLAPYRARADEVRVYRNVACAESDTPYRYSGAHRVRSTTVLLLLALTTVHRVF